MSTGHSSLLYIATTSRYLLAHIDIAMLDYVVDENNPELLSLMIKTKTWGSELDHLCCRAARQGFVEILKILFEADVNINGNRLTPSSLANSGSDSDASIILYTGEQRRPLIAAIEAGQVRSVELLLAMGADPNLSTYYYQNALETAVKLGGAKGIQVCRMLLKAGVDLVDTYPSGITALQVACKTGQEEIVKLLLSAGAHPNHYNGRVDLSSLGLAVENEHIRIISLLVEFGADVNKADPTELTPLERACYLINPRLDIVEILIKAGAKLNEVRADKLLQNIVVQGNGELVKLLLQQGASVNMDLDKADVTPLALAAKQGLFEIMHILLDWDVIVEHSEDILSWIPPDLQSGEEYEDISRRLRITA
jgi:ankyrin repeat protein